MERKKPTYFGPSHKWTPEEDRRLAALAPLGMRELRHHFDGLRANQIHGRAARLGLKIPRMGGSRAFQRGRMSIPAKAHPLVRQLVEEANRQRVFWHELAERAGVTRQAMSKWRYSVTPHFTGFIAAANALGMDVRLVHRKEEDA